MTRRACPKCGNPDMGFYAKECHRCRVSRYADSVEERFLAKVEKTPDCWLWRGNAATVGYGQVQIKGRRLYTHRVAYELWVGPIPAGFEVDHLCDVRLCVNPAHLEAVSKSENIRRIAKRGRHWQAGKTHCPQGHPYEGDNLIMDQGRRRCRTCVNAQRRERKKPNGATDRRGRSR